MNVFHKYTLENLKRNKTRTIVTIIGIILSVSMFTSVTEAFASAQNYMLKYVEKTVGNFMFYTVGQSEEEIKKLEENENVSNVEILQEIGYATFESANSDKPYLFIGGVDEDFADTVAVNLTEGRMAQNTSEIVISAAALKENGKAFEIGETITVYPGQRYCDGERLEQTIWRMDDEEIKDANKKVYTVVGIMARPSYQVEKYEAPGYTAYTLKDGVCEYNTAYVCAKNAVSMYKLKKEILSETWQHASPTAYNTNLITFSGIVDDNLGVMIYGLAALLILIIVVGSVGLIYNSFSISVSERIKQFGILKSIGATKKQLLNSVLFESLALCAVAVPLGLIAGCVGLGITFELLQSTLNTAFGFSVDGLKFALDINLPAILVAAFISIFTAVISAYIPAKKAVKISPIEAIRQSEDIKIESKNLKISPLTYKLFGISGMVASKNFKRNKKKYRVTIMSLFLSIVLFACASSLCSYFKKGISYEMSQYSNYDISVFCDFQDKVDELFSGVKNLNGVKSTAFSTQSDITYVEKTVLSQDEKDYALPSDKYGSPLVNLAFVDDENFKELLSKYHLDESEYMNLYSPKALLFDKKIINYRSESGKMRTKTVKTFEKGLENFTFTSMDTPNTIDSEKYGEIWFSGEIKEENGKVYAKYETVPDEGEEIKEDEFEWSEISIYSYNVGKTIDEAPYYITEYTTLIYPLSAYDAVMGNRSKENDFSQIFVEAENHKTVSSEIFDLVENLGLKNKAVVQDYAATIEMTKAIITLVNVLSYGFIILISLISVANVFNTITTNIYLRRREFAMLKSIGMTEKEFSKMLTFESLIYGLKSLLWGLPVSLLFCFLTYYITYSAGYDIEFYFPVRSFLLAAFSVLAVVFSSVIYSMKKVEKDNTIEALKNENI